MGEKEEHDEMQQNVCVSMLRNIVRRSHKISNDSFNFLEIFDTISSHNFRRFFFLFLNESYSHSKRSCLLLDP